MIELIAKENENVQLLNSINGFGGARELKNAPTPKIYSKKKILENKSGKKLSFSL